MTAEERIASLHARMAALTERRERRKTAALGAGCAGLALCVVLLIFSEGAARGGTAGEYTGAMMLFENAGGYVLLSILAFMAGVIITVLCIRYRKKAESEQAAKERKPI